MPEQRSGFRPSCVNLQVDRFKHVKLDSENDMLKTNKRVILSESIQHHVRSMLRIVHQHINTINLSYAKPKVKKGIEKRNRNGGYNKVYCMLKACKRRYLQDIKTTEQQKKNSLCLRIVVHHLSSTRLQYVPIVVH